jgi:hypothetical protein
MVRLIKIPQKINANALDTEPKSGCDGSVSDKDALKGSLNEFLS